MKLEQNPLVIFAGGIAIGILIEKFVFPAMGFSFATVDCGQLCSDKKCSEYNANCTAGCTACPPTSGGTTSGGNVSGSTWYKAKGSTVKMGNARCNKTKCGQDSGSGSGGNRWETVQSNWFSSGGFEVVAYFTVKKGSMCNGGHIGLKHGGPEHKQCSDSDKISCGSCHSNCSGKGCCCWWDTGIRDNGTVYAEIERPHSCNINSKTFGNIGTRLDTGKKIGVRWYIAKESGGIRLMQFVDTNGGTNWKPTYNILDKGQFMPTSYYSKITKTQNVEIRMSDVNCNDVTMSASTRKL